MPKKTEVVAIIAGTLIIAGGIALQLSGKTAPPEIWIAGTAALSGGFGLALPSSSTTSETSAVLAAVASDFSKLAGYLTAKASPAATGSEPAPAATATGDGPAAVAPQASPSATAAPAPATPNQTATLASVRTVTS